LTDKTRSLARLTHQCVYVCARAAEREGDDECGDEEDEMDYDDESVASSEEVDKKDMVRGSPSVVCTSQRRASRRVGGAHASPSTQRWSHFVTIMCNC